MEKRELKITYTRFSLDELNQDDKNLVNLAIEAAKDAYAPYSNFNVGVSVKLNNGSIIKGNNQENAAYPSGLCAERVAIFYANANFPNKAVDTLTIVAMQNGEIVEQITTPCGSCRQVIAETEFRFKNKIRILLVSKNDILEFKSIDDLLPFSFNKDNL